jgi:hypothetical protein
MTQGRIATEFSMKQVAYALLMALLAVPAHAEWAKKDYATEYDNCTPACYKNNPKAHDKCDSYCHCVTDGMQTQFSDHDQLMRDTVQQKMPDRIAALQRIANRCNQQIWGNPARKLKL